MIDRQTYMGCTKAINNRETENFRTLLQEHINAQQIEETTSPWNTPVFVV